MTNAVLPVEEMAEFALQKLLAAHEVARGLPRALAAQWPDCAPLELTLALSLAASGLESAFSNAADQRLARETWRVAALVAVDCHMMQRMGLPHGRAADLVDYWRHEDPFFLL
ncbi:hypothetical protein [Gemmobacter caeruleus]|uniref:hypothetical protein n=1 Tax=Gemmobacter caeruleus TaxID=2595004 RepID=UPI0011EF9989|nr:hypothetical protein [Gemmobacter caeruleus]